MTTIAYRDDVIAADTQCNSGSARIGDTTKIGRAGRILYGASGDAAWSWRFRSWVRDGCKGDAPKIPDGEDGQNTGGFLVMPDDLIVCFHVNGLEIRRVPFYADGSGWEFATGAMEVGAPAHVAVIAAAAWDHGTGGEVMIIAR